MFVTSNSGMPLLSRAILLPWWWWLMGHEAWGMVLVMVIQAGALRARAASSAGSASRSSIAMAILPLQICRKDGVISRLHSWGHFIDGRRWWPCLRRAALRRCSGGAPGVLRVASGWPPGSAGSAAFPPSITRAISSWLAYILLRPAPLQSNASTPTT